MKFTIKRSKDYLTIFIHRITKTYEPVISRCNVGRLCTRKARFIHNIYMQSEMDRNNFFFITHGLEFPFEWEIPGYPWVILVISEVGSGIESDARSRNYQKPSSVRL